MSEEVNSIARERESFGRIEVVPEILLSIAERNAINTQGVVRLTEPPSSSSRRQSKRLQQRGIVLTLEDHNTIFDIYVIMDANVNIMETGRKLQSAVIESVDRMVGVPVSAVNIHVENVEYPAA